MENPSFCRDFRMSCCTLRGTPIDATRSHSSLLLSLLPTGITMPTQTGFCSSQISWSSGVGHTLICLLCVMNLSGACLGREVSSISWSFLLSENVSELSLTGQAFPESWKHAQQERKTHKISKIQAAFHLALNESALVESLFYLCFTFASISTPNPPNVMIIMPVTLLEGTQFIDKYEQLMPKPQIHYVVNNDPLIHHFLSIWLQLVH